MVRYVSHNRLQVPFKDVNSLRNAIRHESFYLRDELLQQMLFSDDEVGQTSLFMPSKTLLTHRMVCPYFMKDQGARNCSIRKYGAGCS
jgi:hypothetical protein